MREKPRATTELSEPRRDVNHTRKRSNDQLDRQHKWPSRVTTKYAFVVAIYDMQPASRTATFFFFFFQKRTLRREELLTTCTCMLPLFIVPLFLVLAGRKEKREEKGEGEGGARRKAVRRRRGAEAAAAAHRSALSRGETVTTRMCTTYAACSTTRGAMSTPGTSSQR